MSSRVPLFSAEKVNNRDFISSLKRVIDSHKYILGDEVTLFENEFAAYCGVKNCVSVANGTDALELGLRSLDVKKGDVVLLIANAAFYGSTAVHSIGAIPHYVDIDPKTLTMSSECLKIALVHKPKAIIVTHLYGQLADIETIVDLATQANIPVLEDCAQAHGARINGKFAGSFGAAACFSFYPTKNLGALGDGGAVITSDDKIKDNLKKLRQYGWGEKYHVDYPCGRNSRLDEMQAAILREKLPYLDQCNNERREIAKQYNKAFSKHSIVCPPSTSEDYVAHLYVIQINNRTEFREYMTTCGIMTDIHYPIPDYRQKAYVANSKIEELPHTEYACSHVISLPCFPGMTNEQINSVISAVCSWFKIKKTTKN